MENEWFFEKDGVICGPINDTTLLNLVEKGRIIKKTPIRFGWDGDWHEARDIEGVFEGMPISNYTHEEPMASPASFSQTVPFDYDGEGDIITCPHCWVKFQLDKIHYISKHPSLMGDPVAGDYHQLRFLPTVFSEAGHAVDSTGEVCTDMACPNCHMRIPESIIDLDSMFYSIVGAPSSGKSYFLTAMIWELRKQLPEFFDLAFSDSDTVSNRVINEYERLLFLNPSPEKVVALPKTDVAGDGFSNEVMLNNMDVPIALPLPFVFTLKPTDAHFKMEEDELKNEGMKNLVLYDNAGEHFQPGEDTIHRPGTKHMVHSDGLIFLFDPVADTRMRIMCDQKDPQLTVLKDKICNQGTLLTEMIGRIRKYKGIYAKNNSDIPLVISVTKYDIWKHLFPDDIAVRSPWTYDNKKMTYTLNYAYILNVSFHLRELLRKIAPEFIAMAESFSTNVYYLPSSSFGTPAEQENSGMNNDDTFLGIRPQKMNPIWVSTPMILFLAMKGYVPWDIEVDYGEATEATVQNSRIVKESVIFKIDGCNERFTLPKTYCGVKLYHPELGRYFTVPGDFRPLVDYKEFE